MSGSFAARFGRDADVIASAPGRVNLIGEHTDYNDGLVLPLAIPQRTVVHLAPRDDRTVRVASVAFEARLATFALGDETPRGDWVDYVQGCTRALTTAGFACDGFDALVTSTVPVGSGLSSSAALEVAVLRALRHAFGLALDDVTLARIAQRAETDFVGARVGIMDQMASSLADVDAALLLDCRSMATELVSLPANLDLVVVDSGIRHANVAGDYNRRREECETACAALGVASLRDVGPADLSRIERLAEPLARRARHVVTENARVVDAVAALRVGDLARLGALFVASHASLRDDYEVSLPAVDRLVEIATADPAVFGARMTGGGFGGAIVVAARRGEGAAAGARIVAAPDAQRGPARVVAVCP